MFIWTFFTANVMWWDFPEQMLESTFGINSGSCSTPGSTPRVTFVGWILHNLWSAQGALELSVYFKHHICRLVTAGWSTWQGFFLLKSTGSPQETFSALQQGLMHLWERSLTKGMAAIRKTKEGRVPVIISRRENTQLLSCQIGK